MLVKFLMLTIVDYFARTCPHVIIGRRTRLLYIGQAVATDKFILRVRRLLQVTLYLNGKTKERIQSHRRLIKLLGSEK